MKEEKEKRNSINRFELEGNVGNIGDVYTNSKGRKSLRFDLGQNNNENTQFVPIILKGHLVDTYGAEITKGDWITVKGRISAYTKDVEKNGKTYKEKVTEILGFQIEDKNKNLVYQSDGMVTKKEQKTNEQER